MRQSDATGVTKSSYRITVRQLESLIRLSEAVAKLFCSYTVDIKHVREAASLLRKSIVRIESDDVEVMYDEEMVPNVTVPAQVEEFVPEDSLAFAMEVDPNATQPSQVKPIFTFFFSFFF